MKIVVTDGYTLNSGDLTWEGIASLGELVIYERTFPHQVVDRCRNATIILTNKTPFSRNTIEALPQLRCISVLATGYNVIDTTSASEHGIIVCNVPGYGTNSVAQHVFALLLELTNAVGVHHQSVRKGDWQRSADWSYTCQPIMELHGKTFGIVGYGNIGQQVARIADAFGMKVLYFNPNKKLSPIGEQASLERVFCESDVVSLHCPLTDDNRYLVNRTMLEKMKPSAFLINTARGPLVNEQDLAAALNAGIIAGAGLDVLEKEPPTKTQAQLIQAKNCIITPHNAWMSREARKRMMHITKENIEAFLNGKPVNRVV